MTKRMQPRDMRTGRYGFAGKLDRRCGRCGAQLGEHTAAAPHTGIDTTCDGFRLGRQWAPGTVLCNELHTYIAPCATGPVETRRCTMVAGHCGPHALLNAVNWH